MGDRRLRSIGAVLTALLLVSMVLVGRVLDAATGSDIDGVVTVDQARPMAGSTVQVGLANLTPSTPVSVQLCAGYVNETPLGEPLMFPAVFADEACQELATLTTDASGAAQGPVQLPSTGQDLAGMCSYDAGPSSISFATQGYSTCTIAAVTDTNPADGIEPLASTRIAISSGPGSITGTLTDTSGAGIGDEAYTDFQLCPGSNWSACKPMAGAPLFERTGSSFRIDGLANGEYTIIASAYLSVGGSDVRRVVVAGETTVDLVIPAADATSHASPGVELVVTPASPINFDSTIEATASGFAPGDQIELGLCSMRPTLSAVTWMEVPRVTSTCTSLVDDLTATADASGQAEFALPYSPERFMRDCPNAFDDSSSSSFSFVVAAQPCYVTVLDSTGTPSYAWQQITFRSPAGSAVVSGTVRADGDAIQGASVNLAGPVGRWYRTTDSAGGYAVGGQPDGAFTVTGILPSNYFFERPTDPGGSEFSFPTTRTLVQEGVIAGQESEVVDLDFDILPGGVSGTVLRSDGSPLEGASLALREASGGSVYLYGRSGEGGSFSFHGLPPDSYELVAYDYTNTTGVAHTIVQVASQNVGGVQLRFPRTNSSISGTIMNASGEPVAGAYVSACRDMGTQFWWYNCRSAVTAADGSYSIAGLSAGNWRVAAYSPFNYLSHTTTSVVVAEDENLTGVDLTLTVDSGAIQGVVTDESGDGIANASVYACTSLALGSGCASAQSGPSGQYMISGAPNGTYTVTASAPERVSQTVSATVAGGALTNGVDLELRRINPVPPQTTVGYVDGDQSPGRTAPVFPASSTPIQLDGRCAGADVEYELRGADGSLWASGTLTESPAGTYSTSIPPLSGRSGRGELAITVDCPAGVTDPDPVLVDVYIDPSGNVVDTDGNPIEGATVTLSRADTEAGPFAQVPDGSTVMSPENRTNPDMTDATGHFGWLTVPGFYKVRAEKTGCRSPGDIGTSYVETPPLPVPPEQVGLELVLDCSSTTTDTEAPTIDLQIDDEPNGAGWTDRLVPASVTAADTGSGVATLTLIVNGVDTDSTSEVLDDGEYQVSARAVDAAGNVATSPPIAVKVDTTEPDIMISSPVAGQAVTRGSSLTAAYECSDAGSGVDSCEGTVTSGVELDTSVLGSASFQVVATDNAGHSRTTSVNYTVVEESAATDRVELTFSGSITGNWSGEPTGGDLRFKRGRDGNIRRITGTVEMPGRDGGTATVKVDLSRLALFGSYVGSIRVSDRTAGIAQETPVVFVRMAEAADGTVSGRTSWYGSRMRPYRLAWTLGDAG